MEDQAKRAIAAFALAPLVPPLVYWALGPSHDADSLVAAVLVGGFMVTYPVTIGVGLPAYVLITKHGTLRLWHVLAISAATGSVAALLHRWAPPSGAALGASAGLTFWLIWYRRR